MPEISFRLDGKVVMITGAGRGIGKRIATASAQAGADVVILDILADESEATAIEVRDYGRQALVIAADITDQAARNQAVEQTLAHFGQIDVLVNNAAINVYRKFVDVPEEEYDKIMAVDLKAAFFLSQKVAQTMIEAGKGGKIINITSAMALVGGELRAVYCACKGGLLQLTKVMAIELAEHNIQVNAIAPTFIRTQLNVEAFSDEEFYSEIIRRIPAHHTGEVEDVAAAVVYLASPAADFVTGHCLSVDGGYVAW